ncbi:glycosyltransferase family 2 protein [Gammaproteobacteria bacterium]|nr:glycosyltransferase family 2 protein [Gammaproteobacteria bacterium]
MIEKTMETSEVGSGTTENLKTPFVSIVTPAYNEKTNLPELYERLRSVMNGLQVKWEWLVVDDHSTDSTFSTVEDLSKKDSRVRGIRFARNHGAHLALTCALHHARGDCAIGIAADLQDPPETIPTLIEEWNKGANVVWAARSERLGENTGTLFMARAYYWVMRSVVGFKDMSSMGADFFLIDRQVLNAFRKYRESNISILALITWMGFRQTTISYTKQARAHGRSGWTLKKKLKLLVDSVTGFSYVPIRFMSYLGMIIALLGFLYAIFLVFNALAGEPPQGWTTLLVVVLLIGGMLMIMMGVLGEYLWRTLDEARNRPLYIVEETTFSAPDEI